MMFVKFGFLVKQPNVKIKQNYQSKNCKFFYNFSTLKDKNLS